MGYIDCMRTYGLKTVERLFIFMTLLLFSACSLAGLASIPFDENDSITGTYKVFLYGANHASDLETAVFFDLEGDDYNMMMRAAESKYSILNGLAGPDAIKTALKFIKFHRNYSGYEINKILGKEGRIIGYEVKPTYLLFSYPVSEVIHISYQLKEHGNVFVSVFLDKAVDDMIYRR